MRKVEGGIAAVKKFSGRPKEEIVIQKEKELRSQLLKDGLKPQHGCLLARYNDPRTQSFIMVCFLLGCPLLFKLTCDFFDVLHYNDPKTN